jgi:aspartyl protease family protein
MHKFQVALAVVGISLLQPLLQTHIPEASAQDESACYMVSTAGKVVDLSGICGSAARPPVQVPTTGRRSTGVFQTRIKRRQRGIPVIDVVFNGRNGSQVYEMIVDTGASATAITMPMAQALGISTVGMARMTTASQESVNMPLGYVNLIEVNGATAKNVLVAILPVSDIGLLGHDFFGNYEVTVKRDIVEFRVP